jgi:hypothetical protein
MDERICGSGRCRELQPFAAQLRNEDELAVESTGNTRLFHDAVVEHVAVVNPSQFKVISQVTIPPRSARQRAPR